MQYFLDHMTIIELLAHVDAEHDVLSSPDDKPEAMVDVHARMHLPNSVWGDSGHIHVRTLPCKFEGCTGRFDPRLRDATAAETVHYTGWQFDHDEQDDVPVHDHEVNHDAHA